jgi:apolipoprotein N-acyltransferase
MPPNKSISRAENSKLWTHAAGLFALGGLATMGWAPIEVPLIGFAAISIFGHFLAHAKSVWEAVVICLAYALGFHGVGHGWVFQSLLNQTPAGISLSLVGALVFIAYLSLFILIPGVLYYLFIRNNRVNFYSDKRVKTFGWIDSFAFAIFFTGGEYVRGQLFNGFTSLSAGYLFSDWPLRGWMPIVGVYGCSFLLYFAAIALSTKSPNCPQKGAMRRGVIAATTISLLVLGTGAWLDGQVWVQPLGAPVTYRLIQGSVAQQDKFSDRNTGDQTDQYITSITAATATIIVTPETAFPSGLSAIPNSSMQKLSNFSTRTSSNLFIGSHSISASGDMFNSIFQIAPGRSSFPKYDKIHLMPFGEYAPAGLQTFTDSLSIHRNSLTAGSKNQKPFEIVAGMNPILIGPLICSDDQTSDIALNWTPDANMLISSGNLAWFEGSLAIQQMLQIVRVRAIESGRPVLRVANTGVTAHIDHRGRVMARLEIDHSGVLSGSVQPMSGSTPFSQRGGLLVTGLIGFFVLAARMLDWHQRHKL